MEGISLKYKSLAKALASLNAIIPKKDNSKQDDVLRDATIQRFEYTFEAFWKFVHSYLKIQEGVYANSPKSCFRELFSVNLISEDECLLCLAMTDRRNETVHTYNEDLAEAIYKEIAGFAELMNTILLRIYNKPGLTINL